MFFRFLENSIGSLKRKNPIETKETKSSCDRKNLYYLHICCGDFPQKDASVNKRNTCRPECVNFLNKISRNKKDC